MRSCALRGLLTVWVLACLVVFSIPAHAAVPGGRPNSELAQRAAAGGKTAPVTTQSTPGAPAPSVGARTYHLFDGATATLGADGFGVRRDARGGVRPFFIPRPQGRDLSGDEWGPDDREIIRRASLPDRGAYAPGELLVVLDNPATAPMAGAVGATPEDLTGDAATDAALRGVGAVAVRPLTSGAAGVRTGARGVGSIPGTDLSRVYVVRLTGADARIAAQRLRGAPGIRYASPNWTVSSMSVAPRAIPAWALEKARDAVARQAQTSSARVAVDLAPPTLPTNYGLTSSAQSYLNANGVNAVGAFALLGGRFGQLPGEGVIVTNVSIGDLTDQAMADAGDRYVQFYGPTTVLIDGQRYINVPSMPLIPAWGASLDGTLDPLAAVEQVDPYLSEVLLDFSVMAPLPHDRQRPGAEGDGLTDLLGIAPGAQYRLIVPEEPTIANILSALVAAAGQNPRPDVITASLGFGFDVNGFPARYLEDDGLVRAAVRSIVQDLGIVVCIASDDGTRIFTPAAVGPDGGAAPTDLVAPGATPTNVDQVAFSTAPSRLDDSGAINAGGSTLDDVLTAPPYGGGSLAMVGAFPTTRFNGGTDFASGFGARVNVAAPSDNILALAHFCDSSPCPANAVLPVLGGGTSASAPMVAAAAAVAIQTARLAGRTMTPLDIRDLLIRTGRVLPNPPQIPTPLNVGRQLDVTAAVEAILQPGTSPSIVRLAVAHRQGNGNLGAAFVEATDPGAIDLEGPPTAFGPPSGQNLIGPITFAPDILARGAAPNATYALTIGGTTITRSDPVFRLLPSQILSAAGLGVVSTGSRSVPLKYEIRNGSQPLASAALTLTIGPSDGTYDTALAPIGPAVIAAGKPFKVSYDLIHVRQVIKPRLIISSINHWSPSTAPMFRNERIIPISPNDTQVTVPADAFTGGAGIYGIGIQQDSVGGAYAWFTTVRVTGAQGDTRPPAPVLTVGGGAPGYSVGVTRAAPGFTVQWDASAVPGATGAALEFSAPGPTLWGSINNFTNQNGDRRDNNGVDAGSTLWRPLPGVAGAVTLDAVALGLPSSLFYTVRVLATNGGAVVGAASPVSGLAFDDGVTPGGVSVNNFDIVPAGGSVVATTGYDAFGNLANTAVLPYTPSTGTYGAPFASDPSGLTAYYMFGGDPTLHRTLTIRYDWYGTLETLESYDSLTGAKVASATVDSATEFAIIGGRVDPAHHRAALLGWSGVDFSDNVLPFDMVHGVLGAPIFADNGTDDRGFLTTLDVDATSGDALMVNMLWGDLCFFRDGVITSADLDLGVAANVAPTTSCMTGLAADQQNRVAYVTKGPIFGFPRLFPVAEYLTVNESALRASNLTDLHARSPLFPVVDSVNGLLIVGFSAADDYLVDNNAMSAVGVFDARSGHQIALMRNFNFLAEVFGPNSLVGNERGIQIESRNPDRVDVRTGREPGATVPVLKARIEGRAGLARREAGVDFQGRVGSRPAPPAGGRAFKRAGALDAFDYRAVATWVCRSPCLRSPCPMTMSGSQTLAR